MNWPNTKRTKRTGCLSRMMTSRKTIRWNLIPTPIRCLSLRRKPTHCWRTGCSTIPNLRTKRRTNCSKNWTGFRLTKSLTGYWRTMMPSVNLSNLTKTATPKNWIRCSKKNTRTIGCWSLNSRTPIRCLSWTSKMIDCWKRRKNWTGYLSKTRQIPNCCLTMTKPTGYSKKMTRPIGYWRNLTGSNWRTIPTANWNCCLRKPTPKNWTAMSWSLRKSRTIRCSKIRLTKSKMTLSYWKNWIRFPNLRMMTGC